MVIPLLQPVHSKSIIEEFLARPRFREVSGGERIILRNDLIKRGMILSSRVGSKIRSKSFLRLERIIMYHIELIVISVFNFFGKKINIKIF